MKLPLVEDAPTLQDAMPRLLREWGDGLELAGTGAEAMGWLEQKRFDLVLLDLGLPDTIRSKVAVARWAGQRRQPALDSPSTGAHTV